NERKSTLARAAAGGSGEIQIIATNIDWVLIATSANDDLNLRRLDRYLSLAWSAGAKPAILVTKSDLVEDVQKIITEITDRFPGVPVHLLKATLEDPTPLLAAYFGPGLTAVVVGSSGVGKSTLINRILGSEVLVTRAIREEDGRGRHTTTSRYLFKVGEGALIDTPGMREIQLTDEDEGLEKLFAEIDGIAGRCRFGNCQHVTEPGCAIRAALDTGDLSQELWDSYLKLLKEVQHQQRRASPQLQAEQKAKAKQIHKTQKLRQKAKDQR
ncbi:MAG: ribosome small subunit-dependent GTPase A, partial [Bdellovibrionota bacterium]